MIILFKIVITMGQATHGMRDGQVFEPEQFQTQQFAHLARNRPFVALSDGEQVKSPAGLIQSSSPIMKKLQQYDKNKLIKVINQHNPTPRGQRNQEKATQQYQNDHDHLPKSKGNDKQLTQSKRLQRLKEQCHRISKLQEEYLQKSAGKTEVDLANHVHLHESIFEDSKIKQRSPKDPQKDKS